MVASTISGHFYLAYLGHYHFGGTGPAERLFFDIMKTKEYPDA